MSLEILGKFDKNIVKRLNKFFKKWRIAPTATPYSVDDESFYFIQQPPNDDDDFDYEYEQYQNMKEPIPE